MDDLLSFFHACLDDDERMIRAAAEDYFYADGHGDAVNAWFARWSPDNPDGMLAEIEAKRRILDLHPTVPEDWAAEIAGDCRTCAVPHPCGTVQALAQPCAGRPGWREEWQLNTQGDHS